MVKPIIKEEKRLQFCFFFFFFFQSMGALGRCFVEVDLSVCVFVCPRFRVFTFEVQFKRLFATTSCSQMSNIFRDFEFLGKSNGMKWSEI